MHRRAYDYVAAAVHGKTFGTVVEVGGRSINGGVRDLISASKYVSVDLYPGLDVDVVADFLDYRHAPVDAIVCCEVLEHAPRPDLIVAHAAGMLAAGGLLVVTCATDPRPQHSGIDGGPLRPGEHYANVDPDLLAGWCGGLTVAHIEASDGDLYLTALKAGTA